MSVGTADPREQGVKRPQHHLVVLSHGLWGSEADVAFLADCMRQFFGRRNVTVHSASSNAALGRTCDGLDVCGDRLAAEVRYYQSQAAVFPPAASPPTAACPLPDRLPPSLSSSLHPPTKYIAVPCRQRPA